MQSTSALISGVKNFVSVANSFVRAFPFSQVKSANANGSAFGTLAVSGLPFSAACGLTAARTFSAGITFELAPAAAGAGVTLTELAVTADVLGLNEPGCEDAAAAAGAAGELPLVSSCTTRFSSSSTRSRSQRSRSVNGAGASILAASLFAGADFEGGLLVSLSSASKRSGTMLAHSSVARRIGNSVPSCLNARIFSPGKRQATGCHRNELTFFCEHTMLLRCLGMLAFET